MTIPNHVAGGEVKVWLDGAPLITWRGRLGYDPATIPYRNSPAAIRNPNPAFDVFYGPYRERQDQNHQVFFDEIKFTSTYVEAVP